MNIFHRTFFSMGTRLDMVIPNEETGKCEKVYHQIQQKTLGLEAKLNYFNAQSTVSHINREANKRPLKIDDQTYRAVSIALEYHQMTNGAFDICKAALKHNVIEQTDVNINHGAEAILMNKIDRSIYLSSPGLKIDLGGIGKGLALEFAKDMLEQAGIKNALLSFGESSIMGLGTHPKGDYWKVGIPNWNNTNEYLHQFELRDTSLSISGNIHRNDNGSVSDISHIIDPETNLFVKKNILVSVVSPSPLEAEVLSTALFVAGKEKAVAIANNFKQIEYVFLA